MWRAPTFFLWMSRPGLAAAVAAQQQQVQAAGQPPRRHHLPSGSKAAGPFRPVQPACLVQGSIHYHRSVRRMKQEMLEGRQAAQQAAVAAQQAAAIVLTQAQLRRRRRQRAQRHPLAPGWTACQPAGCRTRS